MNILMVTRETEAEKRYGIGRSLAPLTAELKLRGIAVDYICQNDLGPRTRTLMSRLYQKLSASRLRVKGTTDFPILTYIILERLNMGRLAAKLAVQKNYTHVHCHDPIIAAGFRLFSLFRPTPRVRWGITEHGFGSYVSAIHDDGIRMGTMVMTLLRRWEAATLCAADWVIAPTHSALQRVAEDLAIDSLPAHWRVIPHALPAVKRYDKSIARHRLGWDPKLFYVLSIGRIAPVKQFSMLITACSRLTHTENLQLVILGEGDSHDLLAQSRRQGLARDVLFAATNDVGLYLSAADLYVSTSASESFGLANLEALYAGAASICTAVGGVPEVVGDGAVLIPPTLDKLLESLQQLIDDASLRTTVAAKGQARAATWPPLSKIAERYETLYR